MSLRSTRTRTRGTALRATLSIFALVAIGGAVSAAALAVANTVAALPSPREANLRRLVDIQALNAQGSNDGRAFELASLTTADDEAMVDAEFDAIAAPRAIPAPEAATGGLPTDQAGNLAGIDQPAPIARPKAAVAKPAARAPNSAPTNTVLSDAQITALKQRLRLSPGQQPYWPEIEVSLRAVARQINEANRKARGAAMAVDVSSPEVERLKNAAMPLLMQMRPDQKAEIVALARMIGMENMVAML